MVGLIALAVSCKKDNSNEDVPKQKYGVDGVTLMPEAVDLGLPSGLKWASFNIGASKPEEYGDYFAWGETITYYSSQNPLVWAKRKETDENELRYNWESYLYANGAENKLTKYCLKDNADCWDMDAKPEGPDGEVKLLPSDDVATVKLGGKWRMPTAADFKELLDLKEEVIKDNSDYTWEDWALATDADGNEVKDIWGNAIHGIRIKRKSTGATLFLPSAGICNEYEFGEGIDSWGYYYSSSLDFFPESAVVLYLTPESSGRFNVYRYNGLPVRPVYKD